VEGDPADARGTLARHVVEVGRVAADDGAYADHGVALTRLGEPLGDERDLERTGHPHHRHRIQLEPHVGELAERAVEEKLGDVVVEATGDDRHAHAGGVEVAFELGVLAHKRSYEANCGPILRPRFPAGGPSSPAWRAGTRCSRRSAGTAAAPARRSRGRIPRGPRTWPGCSS